MLRPALERESLRGTMTYMHLLLHGLVERQRFELKQAVAAQPSQDGLAGRGTDNAASAGQPVADTGQSPQHATAPRSKKSTARGEGREKLISALTKHHQYDDGGCLVMDPISNNELARRAGVRQSTASAFFKKEFKGYAKYRAICRDAGRLADSLKALNGDFSPYDLYGRRPPGEDDREGE